MGCLFSFLDPPVLEVKNDFYTNKLYIKKENSNDNFSVTSQDSPPYYNSLMFNRFYINTND